MFVSLTAELSWYQTSCQPYRYILISLDFDVVLKGYSGVNLIHGLTHTKTVLDSLSTDQVSRPLIYGVLSTSETTARQQYTAVNLFLASQ